MALVAPLAASINIPTVLVGDAGNANDSTGFGGVGYEYHIGTYEVTNSQYTAFLNATAATDTHGLYNSNMNSSIHGGITQNGLSGSFTYSVKSGFGDKPVNYVSFWDAARFSNWLTTGDTETGVYNLNGTTNPTNDTITRDLTFGFGTLSEVWAIPSESEWHKAAYYQPFADGGDTDNYWRYPTASNSITTADANYNQSVGTLTDVGTYSSDASYYGTFDQGGNVLEWNDEIFLPNSHRGWRGGAFNGDDGFLESSPLRFRNPSFASFDTGFRVSSLAPIPEPSAYAAIVGLLGLGAALLRRRRS